MNEEKLKATGFEMIEKECPITEDIAGGPPKYLICEMGYIAGVLDTINRMIELVQEEEYEQ